MENQENPQNKTPEQNLEAIRKMTSDLKAKGLEKDPKRFELSEKDQKFWNEHEDKAKEVHHEQAAKRNVMTDAVMGKLDKDKNKLVKVDEELHKGLNQLAKLLNLDPNSYSDNNGQMKYELKDKNGKVKYWAAYHPENNSLELVSVDKFLAADVQKSGKNEIKWEEHGDNPKTKVVLEMNVKTKLTSMSFMKDGKKEVMFANKTFEEIQHFFEKGKFKLL